VGVKVGFGVGVNARVGVGLDRVGVTVINATARPMRPGVSAISPQATRPIRRIIFTRDL
jgi:hypothetical protein